MVTQYYFEIFVFFIVFEYLLSHLYAYSPWMNEKGLATDIFSALTVWVLSFFMYLLSSAVKIECLAYRQLDYYPRCEYYGEQIKNLGDILNTTLTVNPLIAATVGFFVMEFVLKTLIPYFWRLIFEG